MACCNQLLVAAETKTGCDCPVAGFCARHQCEKTEAYWKLCKTRVEYFSLWEQGRGPCLDRPIPRASRGLGDTLAWLIKAVTFGCVTPCTGCKTRASWLNRLFPYWWRRWKEGQQ